MTETEIKSVYEFETSRSEEFFGRLEQSMPGGNTRTATFFAPHPLTITRGEGAYIWDLDGNRFIDLVNNYTSLVHGHSHPAIVAALSDSLDSGSVHPAPIEMQAELAERLASRVPSVEQVRFTNSGTEANMNAIRLARAVTGRDRVLKFDWGYHGSWEGLPSVKTETSGIPRAILDLIEWVDYNDADGIVAAMGRRPGEIAAIIVEPLLGAGVIPGAPEFLEAARLAADEHGALLIFDEVVSLRIAWGGVQSEIGVTPDLTTFGKVIGGGLPVGALGGPASLMSRFDPREDDPIPHHGTFNGNVMTTTAGVASLDLLTKDEVVRINRLGERLAEGLSSLSGDGGPPVVVTQAGSLVQAHFDTPAEILSGRDLRPGSESLSRFHRAALNHGVYMAPRGEFNVTTAMDEAIVDQAIEGLRAAYAEL